jgi:hypothetical protein
MLHWTLSTLVCQKRDWLPLVFILPTEINQDTFYDDDSRLIGSRFQNFWISHRSCVHTCHVLLWTFFFICVCDYPTLRLSNVIQFKIFTVQNQNRKSQLIRNQCNGVKVVMSFVFLWFSLFFPLFCPCTRLGIGFFFVYFVRVYFVEAVAPTEREWHRLLCRLFNRSESRPLYCNPPHDRNEQ